MISQSVLDFDDVRCHARRGVLLATFNWNGAIRRYLERWVRQRLWHLIYNSKELSGADYWGTAREVARASNVAVNIRW